MTANNPQANPMLAQLRDIHLPDPVSWWPLAWPWWAMLIIVFVCLTAFIVYRKKNKWRKDAIAQLESFAHENPVNYSLQCNRLLKQICMNKVDKRCASLNGRPWLEFLDSHVKNKIFIPNLEAFAFIPDNPNVTLDTQQLQSACEQWIRKVQC